MRFLDLDLSPVLDSINLTDNFIIKKMLGGYDKLNKRCDIRKPITHDILIQLSDALVHICSSKYEDIMFKVAFALAFSAFLRVGEITVTQYRNDQNTLKYSDITLDENKGVLYVNVRFSKTDQTGKSTTLIVQEKPLKSICPLNTLKQYFKMRPVDKNGPVVCHLNGYSVTRYQFYSVLRSALRFLNMNVKEFNTHSFRIGAATSAFVNVKSEEEIIKLGR